MAPNDKQRGDDFKREDILQAVVICDSFNSRFGPITDYTPKALLPLGNVPLLEYTLKFLCLSGVQQVILFCRDHAAKIKAYINNSQWALPSSPMKIIIIVSEDCIAMGDALRDIDAKSLIHNDFILVNADVVGNIDLQPIIEAHKQRRVKSKSAVMTSVMLELPPEHPNRGTKEDDVVLVTSGSQIFSFKKTTAIDDLHIPTSLIRQNKKIDVHYDLSDCHVSICSPEVLPLFTDNFDYLSRDDFIKGILENEEIMGNSIHIHVLEKGYICPVSSLPMYDSVSLDVLRRWTFPFVLDNKLMITPDDQYSLTRRNIYKHQQTTLDRHCKLEKNVIVGQGTEIGAGASITDSVIGKNCRIGKDVKLENAYLMDGVVIGSNCSVKYSFLGNNAELLHDSTLTAGCVLSGSSLDGVNVKVGPDITLEPNTVLVPVKCNDFDESEVNEKLVGTDGHGYLYEPEAGDSDSEFDMDDASMLFMGMKIVRKDIVLTDSDDEGIEEEDEYDEANPPPDEFQLFSEEVTGTLQRALEEKVILENLILEINSLKHGYGIQIKEVNNLVTKSILELPFCLDKEKKDDITAAFYMTSLDSNFKLLMPVLKNYIRSDESQMDCLKAIEEVGLSNKTVSTVVVKLLHYFYNADILSEEVIISWHQQTPEGDNAENAEALRKQVKSFVTWLEEAEEESDDEDE